MSDLSAQLGLLYVYVRTEKFASNFCYEFVLNRDVDTSLPLISKMHIQSNNYRSTALQSNNYRSTAR